MGLKFPFHSFVLRIACGDPCAHCRGACRCAFAIGVGLKSPPQLGSQKPTSPLLRTPYWRDIEIIAVPQVADLSRKVPPRPALPACRRRRKKEYKLQPRSDLGTAYEVDCYIRQPGQEHQAPSHGESSQQLADEAEDQICSRLTMRTRDTVNLGANGVTVDVD